MSEAPQDLAQQVQQLSELVQKQGKLIAQTGKRLMEMQLTDVKSRMAQMDNTPKQPDFNPEDYATNEDIVQLVCELQGQLDFMEERSIARTHNSHITTTSAATEKIAPLCNRDGVAPPVNYPQTVADLNELKASDLLQLCEFYELIMENDANPELEAIVKSDTLTAEDAEKLLGPSYSDKTIEEKLEALSAGDVDDLFDELTRFIGIRIRRGANW